MSHKNWDYIVIGLGAFGASSLYELAQQGHQVLGLDAHQPGDQHTLSYGHTRLFRELYTEDESFIAEAKLAKKLWYELEQKTGNKLVHQTGHHYFYHPDKRQQYERALAVAKNHKISLTECMATEHKSLEHYLHLYEPEAMTIDVSAYYQSMWQLISATKAELKFQTPVMKLVQHHDKIEVVTEAQTYFAKKVVLSAGQWCQQLLASMNYPLPNVRFERAPVLWFQTPSIHLTASLSVSDNAGHFFVIPNLHDSAFKVFNYFPTQVSSNMTQHQPHFIPGDQAKLMNFGQHYFELDEHAISDQHVCLFHSTPDERFLLHAIDSSHRLVLASGDSGHAFKFAPLLGRRVIDYFVA